VELEKKWRAKFAERAVRCRTPSEISHWTAQGFETRLNKIGKELRRLFLPGQRVLDLGSGPGAYSQFLGRPVLLDYAREVFTRTPPGASPLRVCGDFQTLPFRPTVFDGVLCVGVLQCRRLKRADLSGVANLLKPKGWFLFETLNCESAFFAFELAPLERDRLRKFLSRTDTDPCYYILEEYVTYQASKLIPWFEEAGLKVRGVRYLCAPDPLGIIKALAANRVFPPVALKHYSRSFYIFGVKE
jgi:SAM-dependent methyltransferase